MQFEYSPEDQALIDSRKWSISNGRVRATAPVGGERDLARIIMRAGSGEEVDHADRNPLNCKRDNLRIATRQQNAANREFKNGRKYRGVAFHNNRFQASIRVGGSLRYLGRFLTEKEAADAYDAAALDAFGEFAWQNGAQ